MYLLDYDGLDVSYFEDPRSSCMKQFSHFFSAVAMERLIMMNLPRWTNSTL